MSGSGLDAGLAAVAAAAGIADGYRDQRGQAVASPAETAAAILDDLGYPARTAGDAAESLERLRRLRGGIVPPIVVAPASGPVEVILRLPAGAGTAAWTLTAEDGTDHSGRTEEGPALRLPALPAGYHRLTVAAGGDRAEATVIAAPATCWLPPEIAAGARLWGATAPLYGLRSAGDLGIGSFSEAATAAEAVARPGGSCLGLSPFHALFAADRTQISPYSPSSRLFIDPLYVDPTAVEGFAGSPAAARLAEAEASDALAVARSGALVDYAAAWALKRPLLGALWAAVRDRPLPGFAAFRQRSGTALEAHARFEALSEHFAAEGRPSVGGWPQPFRRAESAEVRSFAETAGERVAFHAWLQWIADGQLADAARRAEAAGMEIGLYRDLAVGADRAGSEVWSSPARYAPTLSIGAPPDPLAPQGQDWGLPPLNPLTLLSEGLAAFRTLLAANMRHAGAIRIDHAFQLRRLFLIPAGRPGSEGAYVAYPFEAMLAVLRIESHRHRCLVIGEDLGTAPEGFSEAIMASGILSYRVLYFESEGAGFRPPAAYPRNALAVISTHDLPTFAGWWRGRDVDLRESLGLFDEGAAGFARAAREADRAALAEALAGEGLAGSAPPSEAPMAATLRYLARTPAALAAIQIEDALGAVEQANLPGVVDGHPNWRRRLDATVESLAAPDGPLAAAAAGFAAEGRGVRPAPGLTAGAETA